MKTLAIATSLSLVALVGSTAHAQYGGPAPSLPPVPNYGSETVIMPPPDPNAYAPSPQPYAIEPVNSDDTYDEDGYDVDADVYYDTVAAENYDDGYNPQASQQFQSTLAPYGDWVSDPSYGQVWVPSTGVVGNDFQPYSTGGHWVLTEYGWTWVSDWDWGWGPFHYGRWIDRAGYGWCWVPGSVWGPAWVSWRWGGGYAGWAPLPPRGVTVGPPRGFRSPWRFVLGHELGVARPHYLPSQVVPAIFARTSVVTNLRTANAAGMPVRFNAGPSAAAIHAPFTPVPLRNFAPRVLPRPTVAPRTGIPLQARPWFRAPTVNPGLRPNSIPLRPIAPNPRSVTLGSTYNNRPTMLPPRPMNGNITVVPSAHYQQPAYQQGYRAPAYSAPPAYHYSAPAYRAPSYSAPPAYHYSAPAYHAQPSYSAPAYHYSAPAYHAQPSYSAPSYHYSAPATHYSAPSHSSGFSGGGGGRHR